MPEENMGALISAAVAARVTPEYVEEQVTKRVDALIDEAVNDALRSFSDNGKLIRDAVAGALKVGELDLPSYGHIVTTVLKSQIEANVADLVSGRLAEDMEELLKLAPKRIKLSEIADKMREQYEHDGTSYGEVITVIVGETEYRTRWIYLDEEHVWSEREKYSAAIRLLVREDGTIASATIKDLDQARASTIGLSYGLEQRIRALVACGTVIEVDEDFVQTAVGDI